MPERLGLRIGIDVGGTNTDAVALDATGALLAKVKVLTTPEVTSGITEALASILQVVESSEVTHVMLGTTHATNAVLERRDLRRVAVIRIGSPATHAVKPLFGWPGDLRTAASAGETIVGGGFEFDGREIAPFDADAVRRFLGELPERPKGVAIIGVFSPVNADHESAAADIAREMLGDVDVSSSHEIGSIGLLERENATVLNAALHDVARKVAGALTAALQEHGLKATALFAQNDGTLMSLGQVLHFPVLTIGSGPSNSIRGAAHLTGIDDALVMDVGGTSTDIGAITGGFPRESAAGTDIGGVPTNFRMPDIVTLALGGGSIVGDHAVGPRSVGYRLTEEALVFGGSTPTLTDAAVAAGRAAIGTGAPDLTETLAEAVRTADEMFADGIDRAKTAKGDRPLIAVGGGSVLVPDRLPGISRIHRPENYEVANAIGAAVAEVGGQVEQIIHGDLDRRRPEIERLSDEARDRAVKAGADPATVKIVDIEEVPLAYLTSPAVRVRVRAAGPMAGPPRITQR